MKGLGNFSACWWRAGRASAAVFVGHAAYDAACAVPARISARMRLHVASESGSKNKEDFAEIRRNPAQTFSVTLSLFSAGTALAIAALASPRLQLRASPPHTASPRRRRFSHRARRREIRRARQHRHGALHRAAPDARHRGARRCARAPGRRVRAAAAAVADGRGSWVRGARKLPSAGVGSPSEQPAGGDGPSALSAYRARLRAAPARRTCAPS